MRNRRARIGLSMGKPCTNDSSHERGGTMHRIEVALAIAATAAGMLGVAGSAQTADAELRTAPLTHIGVVVPHMDAAVSEYVRVMGFPSPRVNTVSVPL